MMPLYFIWPGLREYFAANPALTSDLPSTVVKPKQSDSLIIQSELEDSELNDEFYDALARGESFEDEDSDDDDDMIPKVIFYCLSALCNQTVMYYIMFSNKLRLGFLMKFLYRLEK